MIYNSLDYSQRRVETTDSQHRLPTADIYFETSSERQRCSRAQQDQKQHLIHPARKKHPSTLTEAHDRPNAHATYTTPSANAITAINSQNSSPPSHPPNPTHRRLIPTVFLILAVRICPPILRHFLGRPLITTHVIPPPPRTIRTPLTAAARRRRLRAAAVAAAPPGPSLAATVLANLPPASA